MRFGIPDPKGASFCKVLFLTVKKHCEYENEGNEMLRHSEKLCDSFRICFALAVSAIKGATGKRTGWDQRRKPTSRIVFRYRLHVDV